MNDESPTIHVPKSEGSWEAIRQVGLAVVFFGFVSFAFFNGMSSSDIAMWISLACTSGAVSWLKATVAPQIELTKKETASREKIAAALKREKTSEDA